MRKKEVEITVGQDVVLNKEGKRQRLYQMRYWMGTVQAIQWLPFKRSKSDLVELYRRVRVEWEPGKVWLELPEHLQLAD